MWGQAPFFVPYLPIGQNGVKKQVYLVAFIDDATRFLLHADSYQVGISAFMKAAKAIKNGRLKC
ncbi:hypothetical protein CYJ37_19790 [Bacillus sp. UMB0728]|nr:hypothetical protein CYJ37_19790 [Bacillus sp. UMB0728]